MGLAAAAAYIHRKKGPEISAVWARAAFRVSSRLKAVADVATAFWANHESSFCWFSRHPVVVVPKAARVPRILESVVLSDRAMFPGPG
jgi:hypothetical protein